MKKLRNLFLAVLVLIVSVFTVNVAAEEAGDTTVVTKPGKITISNAKDKRTYDIYKIFDLTYSGSNVAYTVDENWEDFFFGEKAPGKEFIVENNKDDAANQALNPIAYEGTTYRMNIVTEADAVKLAKLALEYARDLEADASKTADADGELEFANLDLGYYLVYPQGATEKNEFSKGSIAALTSTVPTVSINVKAGYPTLEKNRTNGFTFDVGQIARFEIKGTVPDTNGFATYTYKITDTFTKGLSLVNGKAVDFVVTINGREIKVNDLTSRGSATLSYTENGFTLDIPVMLYQSQVGKEIKVTYGLEVTEDAIVSTNTYNEAKLTYSNNPKDETVKETVPSREYVYSSKIVVTKVDGKDENVKLAGAKFVLKKGDLFYKVDANGKVTWVEAQSDATEYTTNENGIVEFNGLADGTYSLVETAAPEGYNLLTEAVPVTVSGTTDEEDKNHEIPVLQPAEVLNYSGAQLPSTGGFGTKLFVIIGSLLAMISGVVLVTNKRMAKEEM